MMRRPLADSFFLGLGMLYVLVGLLCNELVVRLFVGAPPSLRFASVRLALLAFDLAAVGLGLLTILCRRRPFVQSLNLVVASLVGAVLLAEGLVRLSETDALRRTMDPYLHHTMRPYEQAVEYWGPRRVPYYTNDLGYRDSTTRAVPRDNPEQTRLLVLGDSFAEGTGVAYPQTFAGRLGRLLRPHGAPLDVLDAGVSGYSPRLSYRQLTRFFDAGYRADFVLLLLDLTDLRNEGLDYRSWDRFSDAEMAAYHREDRRRRLLAPRLPRFVRQRVRALFSKADPAQDADWAAWQSVPPLLDQTPATRELYTDVPLAWKADGTRICQEYLVKIAALCRAKGAGFALVIYPHPQHLQGDAAATGYRDTFTAFAQQHAIALFDLFPAFSGLDRPADAFIPGDIHWNEQGHALVAGLLAAGLAPALAGEGRRPEAARTDRTAEKL